MKNYFNQGCSTLNNKQNNLVQQLNYTEEDNEILDFDQQYEIMIKKQIGGLLSQYIQYRDGKFSNLEQGNKQQGNMIQVVNEFAQKFNNEKLQHFNIISIEELPIKQNIRDYERICEYQEEVINVEYIPILNLNQDLEIIGSNKLFRNTNYTKSQSQSFIDLQDYDKEEEQIDFDKQYFQSIDNEQFDTIENNNNQILYQLNNYDKLDQINEEFDSTQENVYKNIQNETELTSLNYLLQQSSKLNQSQIQRISSQQSYFNNKNINNQQYNEIIQKQRIYSSGYNCVNKRGEFPMDQKSFSKRNQYKTNYQEKQKQIQQMLQINYDNNNQRTQNRELYQLSYGVNSYGLQFGKQKLRQISDQKILQIYGMNYKHAQKYQYSSNYNIQYQNNKQFHGMKAPRSYVYVQDNQKKKILKQLQIEYNNQSRQNIQQNLKSPNGISIFAKKMALSPERKNKNNIFPFIGSKQQSNEKKSKNQFNFRHNHTNKLPSIYK